MSIKIRPLGPIARLADWLMRPLMYFLAGTIWEEPQRTHWWNNDRLKPEEVTGLSISMMVYLDAARGASERLLWGIIPLFHMPVFGGWRSYVVLAPKDNVKHWYVGWRAVDTAGISRIPINCWVRVLEGDGPTRWFGLDADGNQIELDLIGTSGEIGNGGAFASLPLH